MLPLSIFTFLALPLSSQICVSKSNAPWNEWVANVQLYTLNNTTSKTRDDRFVVGYSDWRDKSTTLTRGQTYPLSIASELSWSGYQTALYFHAWIDFNGNGIFENTVTLAWNAIADAVGYDYQILTSGVGTTVVRNSSTTALSETFTLS